MNKYQKESEAAQAANRRLMQCERKVAYKTESQARQKLPPDWHVFKCEHCSKWHRSGSFSRLVRRAPSTIDAVKGRLYHLFKKCIDKWEFVRKVKAESRKKAIASLGGLHSLDNQYGKGYWSIKTSEKLRSEAA